MNHLTLLVFLLAITQFFIIRSTFELKADFFDLPKSDFFLEHFYFKKNSNTNIAELKDCYNNKFILKQPVDDNVFGVVVREKVAADIALSVGIGVNNVAIVPVGYSFAGKEIVDKPATLHSFVPGVVVRSIFKKGYGPDIRQHRSRKGEKQAGFRRVIIKDMALNSDLAALVAFDTFTANHDRHQKNYFYDEDKNRFFAIDLETSFCTNIAQYAYRFFKQMVENDDRDLSLDEINGLIIYQATLKKLIKMYPPKIIYLKIAEARRQAGIASDRESCYYEEKKQGRIQDNYNSCSQLVAVLDILLKNYR